MAAYAIAQLSHLAYQHLFLHRVDTMVFGFSDGLISLFGHTGSFFDCEVTKNLAANKSRCGILIFSKFRILEFCFCPHCHSNDRRRSVQEKITHLLYSLHVINLFIVLTLHLR